MFREDISLLAGIVESAIEQAFCVQFLFEPERHCLGEAAKSPRRRGKVCLKNSFEFEQRFVIERDNTNIADINTRLFQTIPYSVPGEPGIMFFSREALFLGGSDYISPVHKTSRGIVIICRNT
jgi:hypothetical protein